VQREGQIWLRIAPLLATPKIGNGYWALLDLCFSVFHPKLIIGGIYWAFLEMRIQIIMHRQNLAKRKKMKNLKDKKNLCHKIEKNKKLFCQIK